MPISTNTDTKLSFPLEMSKNGKLALVETLDADSLTGYETVDVATGAVTSLAMAAESSLRPFGALEDAWADEACGYDALHASKLLNDGTVVAFASFTAKSTDCKREAVAPELLSFTPAGAGKTVAVAGFSKTGGAPSFSIDGLGTFDRGVVTQCGLEGGLCAAYIEIPAGLEVKDVVTDDDKTDDEAKPTDKPKKKPTKDGSADGVVVTQRPTQGAAPTETSSATTHAITTGCSAAPGSVSGSSVGLAALLGLTVLARRRRSR